jgi:hypothetical protein
MFRYIPFEEIDKNKWNGTVHYANNGNIQGYHWYLKAVLSEWGAIVENDYETVVPVILEPIKPYQYRLLQELGPYSVNLLNKARMNEIMPLLEKHNKSGQYPINSRVSSSYLTEYDQKTRQKSVFSGGKNYDDLSKTYSDELLDNLYGNGYENIKIMSGKKPEVIVDLLKESKEYKNALMRIMYNAMHRGVGFSNGIEDKNTGEILAISFFLGTPSSISELVSFTNGEKKYRQLIFDLIFRNNSEKASKVETFHKVNDLQEMGFDLEPVGDIMFKRSTFYNLKRAFGGVV